MTTPQSTAFDTLLLHIYFLDTTRLETIRSGVLVGYCLGHLKIGSIVGVKLHVCACFGFWVSRSYLERIATRDG
jgi:hypothetical protein